MRSSSKESRCRGLPSVFLLAIQNNLVAPGIHGRPASQIFLKPGFAMPEDANIAILQVGQLRASFLRTQTRRDNSNYGGMLR